MGVNIPLNAIFPNMWERVENNRFYIGSNYVASFNGNRDTGYIISYQDSSGNGYAPNITRALRKMRVVFWAGRGL